MTRPPFDFDVAIVGGGPAGTSTALHLVRKEGIAGRRLLVLDKAKFPREKPCAGAISQLGIDVLGELGVSLRVPFVTMNGVRLLLGDERAETTFPMGLVVRRSEFDHQLLEDARADGIAVCDGVGVSAITRIPGGFRLQTTDGDRTARLIAACDGAGSTVRKRLGLREPERKGHLYVLETEELASDDGPSRGYVDFDLTVLEDGLQGYYWDFPTVIGGTPHVSRGIYHANLSREANANVDVKGSLAKSLAKRGVDIRKVKLKPFSTRPFVRDSIGWLPGVILVGEAMGIDLTTGEGIAQAIVMGGMAARHLGRALRTGGTSFEGYERQIMRDVVGRHMLQSAWLAPRVYGRIGAPARRYLLRSNYAREAAMQWYVGQSLPRTTHLRLALGLGSRAFA
ncbi:geranylgeranyl reductase [Labilithrix luteola]|uniref:Geranylgeranyl reductase n=1 Tax=Labilithrix luteola TaxID=1391654 RepID=A0A0K1QCS8_9BACT|nr:FAD-dependent monooxygenase [Labilithrix luteola]AKV03533.1 geranylgeranyl reductase [Labilithrix luteola]